MTHTEAGIIIGLEQIGGMFSRSPDGYAKKPFPQLASPMAVGCTTMGLIEAWCMERRARDPLLNVAAEG